MLTVTPASTTISRLRATLSTIGTGLVGRIDLLAVVHADDPDVAAERQRLHAVLRLAATERPDSRPEAEEELADLHARAPGGDVVTGLVEHDHRDDPHDQHDRRPRARIEDRQQHDANDTREQQPCGDGSADLGRVLLEGILHQDITTRLSSGGTLVDRAMGALTRNPIGFENVVDVANVPGSLVKHGPDDVGDRRPRDPTLEERLHRDLIGPTQHRRRARRRGPRRRRGRGTGMHRHPASRS